MCAPQIPVGGTTAAITLTETEQSVLKSLSHLDDSLDMDSYEPYDPRIATDASTISLLIKLLSGSIEQQEESLTILGCLSWSPVNRSAIRDTGVISLLNKMLEPMDPEEPDDWERYAVVLNARLHENSMDIYLQNLEERKWVVSSLFELTSETGSYIKAKGEDGFFLTIARCTNPRVREAWRI
eukprot:2228930-Prymnesium_polylepis.1